MKFGKVEHPELVDFSLPVDHPETHRLLSKSKKTIQPNIYVGCAKWNRADLKGFYPRGTKDELTYYSTQFNSIELNATFYRIFPNEVFATWYDKTPESFRFFPKVFQGVSHWKRLYDYEEYLQSYLLSASHLKEKLAMPFVQLHSNFGPKNWDRLEAFFSVFSRNIPFAIEFRHPDWFADPGLSQELYDLMEQYQVTNIIVDTAGRRDLLHMRMTTDAAFIRYNGANHPSDYERLDAWVDRLEALVDQGLQHIYFFVHQHIERASPLLSAYLIEKLNNRFHTSLNVPSLAQQKHSY